MATVNMLLRELRARGIVTDGVLPFARPELVALIQERHPDEVVMKVPDDARPGPYWLVSQGDADRMEAAGYQRAAPTDSTIDVPGELDG